MTTTYCPTCRAPAPKGYCTVIKCRQLRALLRRDEKPARWDRVRRRCHAGIISAQNDGLRGLGGGWYGGGRF